MINKEINITLSFSPLCTFALLFFFFFSKLADCFLPSNHLTGLDGQMKFHLTSQSFTMAGSHLLSGTCLPRLLLEMVQLAGTTVSASHLANGNLKR